MLRLEPDKTAAETLRSPEGLLPGPGLMSSPDALWVHGRESAVESRYSLRLRKGLRLSPDFKVFSPQSATVPVPPATIIGLRIRFDL
jgi:hypothetical protein